MATTRAGSLEAARAGTTAGAIVRTPEAAEVCVASPEAPEGLAAKSLVRLARHSIPPLIESAHPLRLHI